MSLANLMRQTVDVSRPTPTPDASGGVSNTTATIYADLPADVQPATAQMIALYAQNKQRITHTVFTNQSVTILNGDTITFKGRTLIVTGVRNLIELSRVWAIECYEISR